MGEFGGIVNTSRFLEEQRGRSNAWRALKFLKVIKRSKDDMAHKMHPLPEETRNI